MLRRSLALLLAVGAVLALPSAASARRCPGADVLPTKDNLSKVRAGLACLHNKARAHHGLRRVRHSAMLARAARAHAVSMVRHRFFSHTAPSGAKVTDRVGRTRYARGRRCLLAENLAWATGGKATARQVIRAWLASPAHRANVLDRRFHAVGIGVAAGAPGTAVAGAATFTVVYGSR
jgi:uncharacterized protein YkwD